MKNYTNEKQAGRVQIEPRPGVPGVILIKERAFDPKTGADLGLQVVAELTRAEIDSQIAAAESELAWLQLLSADFEVIAEKP
jgi:hypothetical protein